ncbi:MAG: ATP-binding protein [Verrucomicrobiae bacterium]|nr:ATP-binding protein [Verrucomicrobiae bacterium]
MSSQTNPRATTITRIVALLLLYLLAGLAGRYLPSISGAGAVTLLWPPGGIGLGAALLLGWRYGWIIPAGTLIFALAAGLPFGPAVEIAAAGHLATALGGAFLLQRFLQFDNAMERTRWAGGFLGLAVLICAPLNAAALAAGQVLESKAAWDTFTAHWLANWMPDALGLLLCTPAIITWSARSSIWMYWLRLLEAGTCVTGLLVSALIAFDLWDLPALQPFPVTYVPYLFLVWGALRFGPRGSATGSLLVSALAVYSLHLQRGPFVTANAAESLHSLGIFLGFVAIASLLLAAAAIERRRRLVEVIESEKRLRAVVADQPDLICRFDASGLISFVNPAFCNFHAKAEAQLLGTSFFLTLEEGEAKKLRADLEALPADNPVLTFDHRAAAAAGHIEWHQCHFRRLHRARGPGTEYQAVMQDITPRKRAELVAQEARGAQDMANQQLQMAAAEARAAAESANRASNAKSEFLANMSHEIRTPLSGILGMVELLAQTRLDKRQHEFAQAAVESANALLRVINDVLDFSKIEAGKMTLAREDFSLRSVVDAVLENATPREAGKNVALAAIVRREIPRRLTGDATRLRQVLLNLVGNGVKFTNHGEVVVRVQPLTSLPGKITLRFDVVDTGIGLSADEIKQLFQPFMQVDTSSARKFGGTGLGLAISRKLVELMGGKIGVHSTPGKGSTFWFDLPFDVPPQPAIERGYPGLVFLQVIVATANGSLRASLIEQLHGWGVDARAASSPLDLGHILRTDVRWMVLPLVICDDEMVAAGGDELRRVLAEVRERVPCLLLANPAGSLGEDQAGPAGFVNVLLKPVREQPLFDALVGVVAEIKPESRQPMENVVGQTEFITREPAQPKRTPISDLKILCAEDHPFNRKLAQLVLENFGATAIWAVNGSEAVNKFVPGGCDAILMDCNMPVMDGFEATAAIRKLEAEKNPARRVRIIALTANALVGERERCLAAGMDDYISKPFTAQQVYNALLAAVPPAPVPAGAADAAEQFNPARLEQLCKELDRAPVLDMVGDFLNEFPGRLVELKKFDAAKNWEELERAAHSLKGLAALFGFQKLSQNFLVIEDGAEAADPVRVQAGFATLDALTDTAAEQLRGWLDGK